MSKLDGVPGIVARWSPGGPPEKMPLVVPTLARASEKSARLRLGGAFAADERLRRLPVVVVKDDGEASVKVEAMARTRNVEGPLVSRAWLVTRKGWRVRLAKQTSRIAQGKPICEICATHRKARQHWYKKEAREMGTGEDKCPGDQKIFKKGGGGECDGAGRCCTATERERVQGFATGVGATMELVLDPEVGWIRTGSASWVVQTCGGERGGKEKFIRKGSRGGHERKRTK